MEGICELEVFIIPETNFLFILSYVSFFYELEVYIIILIFSVLFFSYFLPSLEFSFFTSFFDSFKLLRKLPIRNFSLPSLSCCTVTYSDLFSGLDPRFLNLQLLRKNSQRNSSSIFTDHILSRHDTWRSSSKSSFFLYLTSNSILCPFLLQLQPLQLEQHTIKQFKSSTHQGCIHLNFFRIILTFKNIFSLIFFIHDSPLLFLEWYDYEEAINLGWKCFVNWRKRSINSIVNFFFNSTEIRRIDKNMFLLFWYEHVSPDRRLSMSWYILNLVNPFACVDAKRIMDYIYFNQLIRRHSHTEVFYSFVFNLIFAFNYFFQY